MTLWPYLILGAVIIAGIAIYFWRSSGFPDFW